MKLAILQNADTPFRVTHIGIVYLATNTVNGKKYVGRTKLSLRCRRYQHEYTASRGKGSVFHRAIKKYGAAAFTWSCLFFSGDEKALSAAEIRFVGLLNTRSPNGYNLTDGGEGVLGRRLSANAKDRIRAALMGNKHFQGKVCSPEHRKKISDAQKGKPRKKHTEDAKRRIGLASKGNAYRFKKGHVISEGTRRKMSETHKRLGSAKFTAEHRENLKKNHASRRNPEELSRKLKEAWARRRLG